MATFDVLAEQWTLIIFCFEPEMKPVDTFKQVKQVKPHSIVLRALVYVIFEIL